jgi:hypothetical protein
MQLNEEQKRAISVWIEEGLTLAQIQDRLGKELDLRMTYMEARMLVDDLKLLPRESVVEAPKPAPVQEAAVGANPGQGQLGQEPESGAGEELGGADAAGADGSEGGMPGDVKVKVDALTRPGAMVSGSVTFSDGQSAGWYLDAMGRLGMVPPSPGYRPPQGEIQTFQMLLENELTKMGM